VTEATGKPDRKISVYQKWMQLFGALIYEGHFVEDLRSVELGWWEERQVNTAFLHLKGMDGASEAMIAEIPPGKTLPSLKMAIGELVYVLEGNGFSTVRETELWSWLSHSPHPATPAGV